LASCDGSTGLKSKINTLTPVGSGLLRSPEELIARSRIPTYYLAVTKPLAKLSAAKSHRNRLDKQALVAIPDAFLPTRRVWEARAPGSFRRSRGAEYENPRWLMTLVTPESGRAAFWRRIEAQSSCVGPIKKLSRYLWRWPLVRLLASTSAASCVMTIYTSNHIRREK
jgi:hypothetical protein